MHDLNIILYIVDSYIIHLSNIYDLLQDETLLVDWKYKLDRDVETLKAKGNLNSIRSVSRKKILCSKHATYYLYVSSHLPFLVQTVFVYTL